jgi:hypothetical protein
MIPLCVPETYNHSHNSFGHICFVSLFARSWIILLLTVREMYKSSLHFLSEKFHRINKYVRNISHYQRTICEVRPDDWSGFSMSFVTLTSLLNVKFNYNAFTHSANDSKSPSRKDMNLNASSSKRYKTLLHVLQVSLSVISVVGAVGNWMHLNFQ